MLLRRWQSDNKAAAVPVQLTASQLESIMDFYAMERSYAAESLKLFIQLGQSMLLPQPPHSLTLLTNRYSHVWRLIIRLASGTASSKGGCGEMQFPCRRHRIGGGKGVPVCSGAAAEGRLAGNPPADLYR